MHGCVQAPLGSLWVFVFLDEAPSVTTAIAGGILSWPLYCFWFHSGRPNRVGSQTQNNSHVPLLLGSAPRRATTSRANFARAPAASFRPCLYTGAEDAFVARRRVLVSSPVSQSQRGEHIVPNAAAKATFDASTPSGYSKQFTVVRLTVFLRCD